MKKLRIFLSMALLLGLVIGCSKEEAPEFVNEDVESSAPRLKVDYSPVSFGDFGAVELISYEANSDQSVFEYLITAGNSALDRLDLGLERCWYDPDILQTTGGTSNYAGESVIKKHKEFEKGAKWLKLIFDLQPGESVTVSFTLDKYWNAEPRSSILIGDAGFTKADLVVPVCEEGSLATVETVNILVTESEITVNCEVTDDGGSEVYERGVIYSYSGMPGQETFDGMIQAGSGTGTYSAALPALGSHEKIYVRAYAYNRCSSCYGNSTIAFGSSILYPEITATYGEPLVDVRDGKIYRTIQIGTQNWMADNLAYMPDDNQFIRQINKKKFSFSGVYVYNYKGNSVEEAKATPEYQKYGCLYDRDYALTLCPDGWHLPSDEEWKIMEEYLGMDPLELNNYQLANRESGEVGTHLKTASTEDWFWDEISQVLVGDNSSGFSAVASGRFTPSTRPFMFFRWEGQDAIYWTSSLEGDQGILRDLKFPSPGIARMTMDSNYGNSVRCIEGAY